MDFVNDNGLSAANAPGLAEVILGNKTLDEVLVKQHDRLSFLPRGQLSGSALLMLTSPQLASLLAALRQQYQRIIIDTSAVNQAQDSQLIGRQSDGVVLVIQSGRLQTSELQTVLTTLKNEHNVLSGAVLNRVSDDSLESKEGLRLIHQQVGELMTSVKSR